MLEESMDRVGIGGSGAYHNIAVPDYTAGVGYTTL
jgi:hypothetical protein